LAGNVHAKFSRNDNRLIADVAGEADVGKRTGDEVFEADDMR
jgi:hypothetical protein